MDDRTAIVPEGTDDEFRQIEFSWATSEDDLREQPRTAIYIDGEGDLIIRQCAWPDDDEIIRITPEAFRKFIAKLQARGRELGEFAHWSEAHPDEVAAARRPAPPESIAALQSSPAITPAPSTQDNLFRQIAEPNDEWLRPIADYLAEVSRTTIADVAEALHIEEPGTADQRRIVTILTTLGWSPRRDKYGRWWARGDSIHAGDGIGYSGDSIGDSTDSSAVTRIAACANPTPTKRST